MSFGDRFNIKIQTKFNLLIRLKTKSRPFSFSVSHARTLPDLLICPMSIRVLNTLTTPELKLLILTEQTRNILLQIPKRVFGGLTVKAGRVATSCLFVGLFVCFAVDFFNWLGL